MLQVSIYHIPCLCFLLYFSCHHQFSAKRLQSLYLQFICCGKCPAINFLYFTQPGKRACQVWIILLKLSDTCYTNFNEWWISEHLEENWVSIISDCVLLMVAPLNPVYLDRKHSITVNHLLTTLHWKHTKHSAVTAVSPIRTWSWWVMNPWSCQPYNL